MRKREIGRSGGAITHRPSLWLSFGGHDLPLVILRVMACLLRSRRFSLRWLPVAPGGGGRRGRDGRQVCVTMARSVPRAPAISDCRGSGRGESSLPFSCCPLLATPGCIGPKPHLGADEALVPEGNHLGQAIGRGKARCQELRGYSVTFGYREVRWCRGGRQERGGSRMSRIV